MNTTSMETRSDLESSIDNDNDIETDNLSEKPASSGSPLHLPPRPIELAGENTPSYLEEYDEFGEVVMVGDLCFTEKILGSGSYGEVVLAKRILSADDSSADDFTLRGSFNEITTNSVTSKQSTSSDTSKADVSQQSKNDYVAVKIYSKSLLKRMRNIKRSKSKGTIVVHTALDDVEMEIALMKQMRHPNLVSLLQVIDSVDSDALYVVLEFVPLGEIMTFDPDLIRYSHRHAHTPGLTKDGFFTEDFASLFFVDVLHGLAYLHRNCICHRDLKPQNILISERGVAKISDFGVSHFFEEERGKLSFNSDMNSFNQDAMSISSTDYSKTNAKPMKLTRYDTDSALKMDNLSTSGILKSTEGTYPFYSPEMCDGNHSFSGYSSDIWAAGVCLYIFASGQMPFYADSPVDLFHNISRGKVNTKGLHFSKKLKDLLSKILLKDPKKRAGLGDCLKHDFCKEARIERMHTLGENVCRSSVTRLAVNQEDRRNAFSVAKVAEAATRKVTKRLHHAKEISPRPRICHTFSTLSSSSWMDTRDQDFAKSPSTTGGKGAQMRSFMKSLSDGQKTHSSEIGSFCSSDSSTKSKCAIM